MYRDQTQSLSFPPGWSDAQEYHLFNLLRQAEPFDLLLQRKVQQMNADREDVYNFSSFILPANLLEDRELTGYPAWVTENGASFISPVIMEPDTDPNNRLGHVFSRFGLNVSERQIMMLALLAELDIRYQHLFIFVQNNPAYSWPEKGFLCMLLCADIRTRSQLTMCLAPAAPLFRYKLLYTVSVSDARSSMVRIEPAILHYLLGADESPLSLNSFARWMTLPASGEKIHADVVSALQKLAHEHQSSSLQISLSGETDDSRTVVAGLVARAQSKRLLIVDLATLPEDVPEALDLLALALRESRLREGILLLDHLAELEEKKPSMLRPLSTLLMEARAPFFVLHDHASPPVWLHGISQTVFSVPPLSRSDMLSILQAGAKPYKLNKQLDLNDLLTRFSVGPETAEQIFYEAELYRRHTSTQSRITRQELSKALGLRAQQGFGKLAKRFEPVRKFNDLIADEKLITELNDILNALRHRQKMLEQGFDKKINYGQGISVLFYGDSGTGKTMAAEILAAEIGGDLIKVDLANVVNKYIGETEKNLARIFDLAARDAGVLFFDEADALFGKRSEVSDARDRHANIEVSYLLQRLETYPGLVILATNNRGHLDDAFTRRFTFMTRFTKPEMPQRLQMWRDIWPADIRLSADISFERLAHQYVLTGANIRNIALHASWLAHGEGAHQISNVHIENAVARELAKAGRLF